MLFLKDSNCSPQRISADGCEQDTPPWPWSISQEVPRSLSDFSTRKSGCSGEGADIGAFAGSCWPWARALLLFGLSSLNMLAMTLRLSGMLLGGCNRALSCCSCSVLAGSGDWRYLMSSVGYPAKSKKKNLLSPFSSQAAFANYNLMSGPAYYPMLIFSYLITHILLYLTRAWAEGCLLLI